MASSFFYYIYIYIYSLEIDMISMRFRIERKYEKNDILSLKIVL